MTRPTPPALPRLMRAAVENGWNTETLHNTTGITFLATIWSKESLNRHHIHLGWCHRPGKWLLISATHRVVAGAHSRAELDQITISAVPVLFRAYGSDRWGDRDGS